MNLQCTQIPSTQMCLYFQKQRLFHNISMDYTKKTREKQPTLLFCLSQLVIQTTIMQRQSVK